MGCKQFAVHTASIAAIASVMLSARPGATGGRWRGGRGGSHRRLFARRSTTSDRRRLGLRGRPTLRRRVGGLCWAWRYQHQPGKSALPGHPRHSHSVFVAAADGTHVNLPSPCSLKVPILGTRCVASSRGGGSLRGWRSLTPTTASKGPGSDAHTGGRWTGLRHRR